MLDEIKVSGLNWDLDGKVVGFEDVVKRVGKDRSRRLKALDGWGQAFEFRVLDGFLVVRSSGADRVFESSPYHYGTFPWLSGGDFVILGDKGVRWSVPPKAPDWLEDNW